MSPVQGDSLLGTKPESLLGTSPSKLSRQTGGSHSVLVHSINEDGTSQVGLQISKVSVLETYPSLETACASCKPTVDISSLRRCRCGPSWAERCMYIAPYSGGVRGASIVCQLQGDHPSVRVVIEQVCCRPHVPLALGRSLWLRCSMLLCCRWPGIRHAVYCAPPSTCIEQPCYTSQPEAASCAPILTPWKAGQ